LSPISISIISLIKNCLPRADSNISFITSGGNKELNLFTDLKFSCENPDCEGSVDSPSNIFSAFSAKSLIKNLLFEP
jgi:hypothetical protein